jgi:RHS repeat-associated protein
MTLGRMAVGHPVDVATGTVYSSHVDIDLPGRVRLKWEREFATPVDGATYGPLGRGWTARYFCEIRREGKNWRLSFLDGGYVDFADPVEGLARGQVLRNFTAGRELRAFGDRLVVTRWDAETGEIETWIFSVRAQGDAVWIPISIEDAYGQALDLEYDDAQRLTEVRQRREQRALVLEYDRRNRIVQVAFRAGAGARTPLVRYEYDREGMLAGAEDALQRRDRYEYDAQGRMIREFLKSGGTATFEYDGDGRCVRTTCHQDYDLKTLRYFDDVRTTEVTDSLGNVSRYTWNELGQVVRETSPLGAVRATEFDEFGRMLSYADPYGRGTRFAYDEYGNRTEVAHPNGAMTKSVYNERHRLVEITDPVGATWKYEYDEQNRHVKAFYPSGLEWRFHWSTGGDLMEVSHSLGGHWKYTYDELGQRLAITDWKGASCRYLYESRGYITRIIDARGATTRYEYDAAGELKRLEEADGSLQLNHYDAGGALVKVVNSGDLVTTYTQLPCGEEIKSIGASDGTFVRYTWSTEPDRLMAIENEKGEKHTFQYNADGYLVKERFPSGRAITYVRDLAGFVLERTNGAGETTRYERDAVGRILAARYFDGTSAEFEYDLAGEILKASYDGCVVEFERGMYGVVLKEACGADVVESTYDAIGNRLTRRSNLGASVDYSYDPRGALKEIAFSPTCILRRELDLAGYERERHLPANLVLEQDYDGVGRLTRQALTTRVAQSQRATRALVSREFRYHATGNLAKVSDASWGETDYEYDSVEHLIRRLVDGVIREQFSYDESGNIVSATAPQPTSPTGSSAFGAAMPYPTRTRHVDPGDQTDQDGSVTYEYDGEGRLTRKIESFAGRNPQTWEYTWNSLGLLASAVTPSGETWRYRYDAFSRRVRKSGPGVEIRYVWDGNALLHEVPEAAEATTTWYFWPDNFAPMATQSQGKTYLAIHDHIGTPREFVDEWGKLVWSAQFTAWGELEQLKSSEVNCPLRFQGQWADHETGFHYNRLRYYSPELGAFISMDPVPLAGGPNGYRYAPNPITWVDPHGLKVTPGELDDQGRPTGASGTLTRRDLRPTDSSPAKVDPPGWVGGGHPDHQQRSHLLADTLGGSGTDVRNIVALTDGSNHPGMSTVEGKVRRHIQKNGGPVKYTVTVNYKNNHKTPSSVHIVATDKNGKVIVDKKVVNGKRQKQQCCS